MWFRTGDGLIRKAETKWDQVHTDMLFSPRLRVIRRNKRSVSAILSLSYAWVILATFPLYTIEQMMPYSSGQSMRLSAGTVFRGQWPARNGTKDWRASKKSPKNASNAAIHCYCAYRFTRALCGIVPCMAVSDPLFGRQNWLQRFANSAPTDSSHPVTAARVNGGSSVRPETR